MITPLPPLWPEPAPRPRDPVAVAVANASLLGVGYVVLGRKWLAVGTGLVTVVLVTLLAGVARSAWAEVAVLVWWAFLVAHGWHLARRQPRPEAVVRPRLLAAGLTLPVLLAVGLVRLDAASIDRELADARGRGDCPRALAAVDELWVGHHVVDAPLTVRGEQTAEVCGLLLTTDADFDAALAGDTESLERAVNRLSAILAEFPGHEQVVETTLDGYLTALPAAEPCKTTAATDWLRRQPPRGNVVDRAVDVVPQVAPSALLRCGDALAADKSWELALRKYGQLINQYPDHALAGKAEEGHRKATLGRELENVRGLLAPPYPGGEPAYCTSPAKYSGARAYRAQRPNRTLLFGDFAQKRHIPKGWLAEDAADAVLVICAGTVGFGAEVRGCPYDGRAKFGRVFWVSFRKVAVPVKVYELRTGKLLTERKVEIGGASCPAVLNYDYYGTDLGPPGQVHVTPSAADVRAAFTPLINPAKR